ncbi:MAG: hypothetical protein RSA78_07665 [Oscillospiraceae bacterium]
MEKEQRNLTRMCSYSALKAQSTHAAYKRAISLKMVFLAILREIFYGSLSNVGVAIRKIEIALRCSMQGHLGAIHLLSAQTFYKGLSFAAYAANLKVSFTGLWSLNS